MTLKRFPWKIHPCRPQMHSQALYDKNSMISLHFMLILHWLHFFILTILCWRLWPGTGFVSWPQIYSHSSYVPMPRFGDWGDVYKALVTQSPFFLGELQLIQISGKNRQGRCSSQRIILIVRNCHGNIANHNDICTCSLRRFGFALMRACSFLFDAIHWTWYRIISQ